MEDVVSGRRRAVARLLSLPLLGIAGVPYVRAAAQSGADIDAAGAVATAPAAAAFMVDPRAVGLSIGVVHAGTRRSHHYGTVDMQRRRPPDDRTVYPIASLTKTFTATLLAQAQIDGKLKLDDDIRLYLNGDYPNLAYEGRYIAVRHLITHLSGLPRLLPDRPEASPDFPSDVPYPDRLRALVATTTRSDFDAGLHRVKLAAAPGTRFQYSNAAAQLAGFILKRVYGVDFETLVQRRIALPLGMRDTFIVADEGQLRRMAFGYEGGKRQAYFPDRIQAAGAFKSTLADMLAYATWQMAEQDPAVRLSHEPTYRDGDVAIGLNWQIASKGTRRVVFQDGSHPGFACLLALHPDSGMAIVLLSNEIDGDTLGRLRTVANSIAKRLDPRAIDVP
nr:serine hydrolase domain-containing protein [uncultured Massilia sp.]